MKRFFTLFAAMLFLSSGAFAQEKWTNLVKNSNCEGEADPAWSAFWVHEWRSEIPQYDPATGQKVDETGMWQGFAEIVEDPANPKNHCVKVVVRSEAEADAAGNKITQNDRFADYDSQFLIYLNEAVPQDKLIRLRMKIKGEVIDGDLAKQKFATQAHQTPGAYNHYYLFGDLPAKGIEYGMDKWTEIVTDPVIVSSDHVTGSGHEYFQSVAFNLSKGPHAVLYFDDIKVEVKDKQDDTSGDPFNFLTNGTLSDMKMVLPSAESNHDKDSIVYETFTNFTAREAWDAPKGRRTWDRQARVVNDPIDGQPSLTARAVGYNAQFPREKLVEQYDENGDVIKDEKGDTIFTTEIEYIDCYVRENGDTALNNNGGYSLDDWATQFFVSSPHVFKSGQKLKLKFMYRASAPASADTQMHYGPGDYKHYDMLGSLDFTEEWQTYEKEVEINGSQAGGTTIAFNINKVKDQDIDYYFRFEEFTLYPSDLIPDDITLQKDTLFAPVGGKDEETKIEIDMTEMVQTLGIEDLVAFLNDNTMLVYLRTVEGEGDDQEVTEGLSGGVQATTGVNLDSYGSYSDEDTDINIYFPEEEIKGNKVTLSILNYGDAFQPGQTIPTKLYFENHRWLYAFDLTLVAAADYEAVMGVTTLKAEPKATGIIYDLTGRQISKAAKGLYIKDGKKFIVK